MACALALQFPILPLVHVYEVRPRKDECGVDLTGGRAALCSPVVR